MLPLHIFIPQYMGGDILGVVVQHLDSMRVKVELLLVRPRTPLGLNRHTRLYIAGIALFTDNGKS
jgi:hypothetical protein